MTSAFTLSSSSSFLSPLHYLPRLILVVAVVSLPRPPAAVSPQASLFFSGKNTANPWVNTVPEALSDCIDKKQWQKALQVFEMLRKQRFYQPKEGTYMRLLVLLGRCGQPGQAQQLFYSMIEEGLEPTSQLYTALIGAYSRSNILDKAFAVLHAMIELPHCQMGMFTPTVY
ncbi:serine/threonine kinase [Datura stramonium]|uniref:Serine/threonine kinase n=1 Tax=Datura stramonium TaxID=4076 RepID=A0ABS8VFM0_DATST|nr:serine/threonine kinase [Datura stramonium]